MRNNRTSLRTTLIPLLVLLVVCILTIGSSPLFLTNPWDDSNAMLTMGRSILHGLVPYKDVIDQRGPLLYAVFALGATIHKTSFLGIFILQTINVLVIYRLSFKFAKDCTVTVTTAQWAALLGPFALLSTSSFSLSGSPEEFAFTSILYLLYVINHYHQSVIAIDLKTFFFLGLNLSLVFWNKYSMIGAFAFFFIWTAYTFVYKKQFIRLLQVILISVLGFLSISLIILGYFFFHNAIQDLFQIYFVQNITSYGKTDQTKLMQLWKMLFLIAQEIRTHYLVALIIMIGWIKCFYKKETITLEIIIFLGTLSFVAMQHWIIDYYNVIWMPFFAIALMRISSVKLPSLISDEGRNLSVNIILTAAVVFVPFINNQNLNRLIVRKEYQSVNGSQYNAQPMFAKIMREQTDFTREPSLLMINSLDKGFFLSAQTVPKTNYWHKLNMSYDQLPQMYQSFANNMMHRNVDYVIVKLSEKPANTQAALYSQINGAINEHLRHALVYNYKITATAKNNSNEFFILMHKKH
ncbi:teichoic acid glycosyl transferase [Leuconostoc gelidum subsp. gelidum]|uniref:teichoic acid glycosyl transferase n=1 Tax=Leuconostoc gelidum TaxID=1244 RepID=UPI001CC4438F|nr:teichoic acid glycosyl transferase [Leuconostoc gelidum subsp. gelidum]